MGIQLLGCIYYIDPYMYLFVRSCDGYIIGMAMPPLLLFETLPLRIAWHFSLWCYSYLLQDQHSLPPVSQVVAVPSGGFRGLFTFPPLS